MKPKILRCVFGFLAAPSGQELLLLLVDELSHSRSKNRMGSWRMLFLVSTPRGYRKFPGTWTPTYKITFWWGKTNKKIKVLYVRLC